MGGFALKAGCFHGEGFPSRISWESFPVQRQNARTWAVLI